MKCPGNYKTSDYVDNKQEDVSEFENTSTTSPNLSSSY